MTDAFAQIVGQVRATEILRNSAASRSIGSAYLFEGPSSVGKKLCASAFAKSVIAKGNANLEARIDRDQHPDVRVFGPREEGSGNIAIATLREEILPLAQFAPYEATHAFFIFPDAEVSFPSHHPQAANALLKTLEEPKRNVHFILTSSRPFELLTTIRSRCQRIAFEKLNEDSLATILERNGVEKSQRARAAQLSDGNAQRALLYARDDKAISLLELALDMHNAVEARATDAVVNCAEKVAKHEDLPFALEILQQLYRDGCRDALHVSSANAAAASRIPEINADEAARRALLIDDHRRALEHNANPVIATEALLLRMCYTSQRL